MDTQYYTTTTSTPVLALEEYQDIPSSTNQPEALGYYKSRFINGKHLRSRAAAGTCMRDSSLESFWREVIAAVERDSRGDVDGAIFTSDDLGVCLGPWDVKICHHYRWVEKTGGDSFQGYCESYGELVESYEVVSAYDAEYETDLPALRVLLNEFYNTHKTKLHNI